MDDYLLHAQEAFKEATKSTNPVSQTIMICLAMSHAKKAGIKPIDFIIEQVKEIIVS